MLAISLCGCALPAEVTPEGAGNEFEKVAINLLEQGKPNPDDSSVTGYLFKPVGSGPFPAIILMHGCDGLEWERRQPASWLLLKDYAERYVSLGYVALVLDSFTPRGISNICGNGLVVTPQRRAWDAYSAASYLVSLGYVDRQRLVLEGDSHGGWTTLVALEQRAWPVPEHFAAGIAWYPYCPADGVTLASVLILIGQADDWTPADRCGSLAERVRNQEGQPLIELKIFPGATHAYDFPYPERVNAQGHRMRYDQAATIESWSLIDAFLHQRIPQK